MSATTAEIMMRREEGWRRMKEWLRGPLWTETALRPWRELFGRPRKPPRSPDMAQMIDDLERQGYPPRPLFGYDIGAGDRTSISLVSFERGRLKAMPISEREFYRQ